MREMKDSGIEWIGEIPVDWKVIKNKYLLSLLYSGGTPSVSNNEFYCFEGGIPFVSISDMSTVDYVLSTQKRLTNSGIKDKNLKVLPNGTILYSIYATVGAVSELKIEAAISQAMLALQVNSKVDKSFYKYNLAAMKDYIFSNTNGNTQFNLNAEKVKNFYFVLPDIETQQRIADYLDRKCSQIDAIIARQQKVIEKLKAYKLSVITEAVTKGLNPDVPMKDSGIDFIGSIPETWRICRLRNIGTLQNGISKGGEFFGHGFPFVSYGDVYRNFSLPVQVTGLIDSSDEERRNYSVEAGDIFFTRTSETIEEVGFSSVCEETIPDATFAGFLIRVRPFTDDLVPKFAKYYFRSNHHRYYLVKQMNLVTRASLGQDLLKSMPVLVPPKDEQISIAAYLDKKCGAIESSIEYKQRVIERLTAYKKSLIYEVVTGKKAV